MQIDINTLLKGKATIIKGKEYLKTEAYITPFLEKMSKFTDKFIVQVKEPNQISITNNKDINIEDTVFNRVWVQAIMPEEYSFDNHTEVIGLVYGLDVKKPVAKIYRGALNQACLNLCVFNPSFLSIQGINPEKPLNFQSVQYLMEQTSDFKTYLDKLHNTEVPYNDNLINENLGEWVRNSLNLSYDNGYGKVKLAASIPISAYKNVYEKQDSPYYVKPGETTTLFNIYNAFTDIITHNDDRDIMNKAEKTLLLKDIIKIV